MEEISIKAYKCSECNKIHLDKLLAEMCCKKYYCDICGIETEKYNTRCKSCSEIEKFNKAEKYTYEKYDEKFPDNMLFDGESFFSDMDSLVETLYYDDNKIPEYVYGTTKEAVIIDIENVLCDIEYETDVDDFEFDNKEELIKFVNNWNKKNVKYIYYPNEKIIVYIPKELKEEYSKK